MKVNTTITLDMDIAYKLQNAKINRSALINELLKGYFGNDKIEDIDKRKKDNESEMMDVIHRGIADESN